MPTKFASNSSTQAIPRKPRRRPLALLRSPRSIEGIMGRLLIILGLLLVAAGLAVIALQRIGLPIGRLPGDMTFRGRNVTIFAPLGTSLLVSVLLTLVLLLIARFRR